eukprot:149667-Chlamydomonas_euryale.AAC.2
MQRGARLWLCAHTTDRLFFARACCTPQIDGCTRLQHPADRWLHALATPRRSVVARACRTLQIGCCTRMLHPADRLLHALAAPCRSVVAGSCRSCHGEAIQASRKHSSASAALAAATVLAAPLHLFLMSRHQVPHLPLMLQHQNSTQPR